MLHNDDIYKVAHKKLPVYVHENNIFMNPHFNNSVSHVYTREIISDY